MKQSTIKQSVSCSGVGLHSGKLVTLTLHPAAENTGIVFDIHASSGVHRVEPSPQAAVATGLATTLGVPGASVATVEHLLAALRGLEVGNVIIEIEGGEVPIMDGSAGPFVFLIQSAGIEEQPVAKKFIRIKKPIEVREPDRNGDKWARFEPYDGFRIAFSIVFNHPAIDRTGQEVVVDLAEHSYVRDVARARTFGFMQEVEWLRENGLAQGGGLDNAVVLDEYRVLNADGLRYGDEFVKHKVLDAIGDLYLLGHSLLASVTAHKSGHALNNALARELLARPDAWEYVSFEEVSQAPQAVTHWLALPAV